MQPWCLLNQGQQLAERIEGELKIRHEMIVIEKIVAFREAVFRNDIDSEARESRGDGDRTLIGIRLKPAAELLDYFVNVRLKVANCCFGEIAVESVSSDPMYIVVNGRNDRLYLV